MASVAAHRRGQEPRSSTPRALVLERLFDPPSELEQARKRRQKAADALSDAQRRNDTRDKHAASVALLRARHDELRLEVGRG